MDKFVLFRRSLRRRTSGADLVHILDQGNALWVPWVADRPHLITVHDLLALRAARGEFPGWAVGSSGKKLQEAIRRGLETARHTAVVSEATRNDFRRLYQGCPEPVLIPNGMYRPFTPMPRVEARAAIDALLPLAVVPFLLHVGGNEPYKNRVGALSIHRAMSRLDPKRTPRIVLAGHPLSTDIRREAEEGLRDGSIVEVVRPSDAQLQALYSLAEGLLFPSIVEGYGLPILEAQACGCPVFASDRAPLPEVGGEGAAYFDPANPGEAATRILNVWDWRKERVVAGFKNVASRSTDHMAAGYAEAYRAIAKKPS